VARLTGKHEALERSSGRVARNRLRIAWMYYVEGLTQSEIADSLGIGRVTVVRNIHEALKQREVKIWIDSGLSECLTLESALKAKFGFDDAMVVPSPADEARTPHMVGAAAGMYLSGKLADGMTIGVGWGETLYESLQTLAPPELKDVQVISLLGGIVQARRHNPSEFAWQFARTLNADCYLLAAPALVDSAETRQALIERCGLDDVLRRATQMDMAVLSVGILKPGATSFRFGFLTDADRTALTKAGAVGDTLFHFYDAEGVILDHPVNRRVMSVPLDVLRAVPRRIMVSGGKAKAAALRGAIRLTACNVLITDEAAAQALLDD
jgi:deoxyribonucleoside regulator